MGLKESMSTQTWLHTPIQIIGENCTKFVVLKEKFTQSCMYRYLKAEAPKSGELGAEHEGKKGGHVPNFLSLFPGYFFS